MADRGSKVGGVAKVLIALLGAGGGIVALADYLERPMPTMSDFELQTDRYGGDDYSNFASSTADSCSSACLSDARCKAFSYNVVANQCWLKGDVPLRRENQSFVSGVKVLR